MEMRICGLKTNTDAVKTGLNVLKADFKEETVTIKAILNMILQALQPQAYIPSASTAPESQPKAQARAQDQPQPQPQAQGQGQSHSQPQHLITTNQSNLDRWCNEEVGLQVAT